MNLLRSLSAVRTLDWVRMTHYDEVMIVATVHPHGKQRKSIIGAERRPLTGSVSAEILAAILALMKSNSEVLEPSAQFLLDPRSASSWGRSRLNAMAAYNPAADAEDPLERFDKMFGPCVTIGYMKTPNGRGREAVRIAKVSMTPIEFNILLNSVRNKTAVQNNRGDYRAKTINDVKTGLAAGESFGEYQLRHYQDVAQGRFA